MIKKRLVFSLVIGMLMLVMGSVGFAELKMAYGYSTNDNEEKAVEEAFAMMKSKIDSPKGILLLTTGVPSPTKDVGYDVTKVAVAANKMRGSIPMMGNCSAYAVFSNEGFHRGAKGAVAILGFQGEDVSAGTGIAILADADDKYTRLQKIDRALKDAVAMAGKSVQEKPMFIYISTFLSHEAQTLTAESAIDEVSEVLGENIPMLGGVTTFDDMSGAYNIANDKIGKQGVAYLLVYGKEKVGSSFLSGCIGGKVSGIATKVEGARKLKEIDGRPAFDVYNEWSGGKALADVGGSIDNDPKFKKNHYFPLARAKVLSHGELLYIAIRPWKVFKDKTMYLGVNVKEGDQLYYVEASPDLYLRRAGYVARKAMVNSKSTVKGLAGGVHIYCSGVGKAVGFDKMSIMVKDLNDTMGTIPYIGGFTAGEITYDPAAGAQNNSCASGHVVFGKD